jgi:hypothetical protein
MRQPSRPRSPAIAGLVAFFMVSAAAGAARAGEALVAIGLGGEGSSWRTDGAGFGSLQLGFRFADIVAPYFSVRLGYGTVDQRLLTLVQLGAQVWAKIGRVRPYARFGLVHQHEESMAAAAMDKFGALFGVGDGIRHRGGFEGGIGADFPFRRYKSWEFKATVEGIVTGFPDPRGPSVYGGALAGLGVHYSL